MTRKKRIMVSVVFNKGGSKTTIKPDEKAKIRHRKRSICTRKRNIVKQRVNVLKNMIGGKRLRCTEKTYNGRIFAHLLAQSLIAIIYHRVCEMSKDRVLDTNIDKVTDLDGNSIVLLLNKLGHIKAKKIDGGSDAWLVDPLTRKQRVYFEEILKIKIPPRVF